mmetsp:Transcript_134772/g.430684  ORF Transcript_134772/g.430684 Transcript_134772/m.430684 type:complete len:222 (+) Transcript_134772:1011-1676(+)
MGPKASATNVSVDFVAYRSWRACREFLGTLSAKSASDVLDVVLKKMPQKARDIKRRIVKARPGPPSNTPSAAAAAALCATTRGPRATARAPEKAASRPSRAQSRSSRVRDTLSTARPTGSAVASAVNPEADSMRPTDRLSPKSSNMKAVKRCPCAIVLTNAPNTDKASDSRTFLSLTQPGGTSPAAAQRFAPGAIPLPRGRRRHAPGGGGADEGHRGAALR